MLTILNQNKISKVNLTLIDKIYENYQFFDGLDFKLNQNMM